MAAVHHYRRPPCTIDNGTDAPPSAEDMHHEAGTNAPQPEERLHHRSGVRSGSEFVERLPPAMQVRRKKFYLCAEKEPPDERE